VSASTGAFDPGTVLDVGSWTPTGSGVSVGATAVSSTAEQPLSPTVADTSCGVVPPVGNDVEPVPNTMADVAPWLVEDPTPSADTARPEDVSTRCDGDGDAGAGTGAGADGNGDGDGNGNGDGDGDGDGDCNTVSGADADADADAHVDAEADLDVDVNVDANDEAGAGDDAGDSVGTDVGADADTDANGDCSEGSVSDGEDVLSLSAPFTSFVVSSDSFLGLHTSHAVPTACPMMRSSGMPPALTPARCNASSLDILISAPNDGMSWQERPGSNPRSSVRAALRLDRAFFLGAADCAKSRVSTRSTPAASHKR